MFKRIFGQPTQGERDTRTQIRTLHGETAEFGFKPERAYLLLGGKQEDFLTNCPSCGAPFHGPTQSVCIYCQSQRKVYYADVTNVDLLSQLSKKEVEEGILVLPGNEKVFLGKNAVVAMVVAQEVYSDGGLSATTLVSSKLEIKSGFWSADYYPSIGTAVIVDGGHARFGFATKIETLIIGREVGPLVFGEKCKIENLLSVGSFSYNSGSNLYIRNSSRIPYQDYLRRVSKILESEDVQARE